MKASAPSCTHCQATLLSPEFFNGAQLSACPHCGVFLQVLVFPAYFLEPVRGQSAENLLLEGEASCFYHPQKKAVLPCGNCGRFLCALCDVELNGQHLCPACLERGQQKRTLKNLENHRVRYGSIALAVALIPILVWPVTLFTAAAALYITVRHWNSPGSIVGSSKFPFILAALIALLEIAGWIVGLYFAFTH